jgi:4a-hydroxytetrahydrobiopterin dehydratase
MARLSDSDIAKNLASLTDWKLKGNVIEKLYRFDSFGAAIGFVNRVAGLAEEVDHHPDILVQYDRVTLTLSSHDSGGLTERDFRLAGRIDRP